ncbi:MAG: FimV family protein [Gammaproteobacteria bacterium]|nr:FimV family protein [Gammaproteobacteria bacterium]
MFKRLAFGLAVFMCWVPVQVFALGLGNIEMRSALNQALDARIELLRARSGELKDLSITLASADTFKRAGMDRPAFLTQLRFEVVTNPSGAPYIQVKSSQPITEPFLNFLIEVNWPNGRLLREFTVLVDPPVLTERAPGAVEAPVTQNQTTETNTIDRSASETPAVAPIATGAIEVPVPPQRAKPETPAPTAAPEPVATPEPPATTNERAAIEAEPAPPKPAPEVAKSRPRPRPTRVAPPKPVEEEKPGAAAASEGGSTQYSVKANDTMWSIATKLRPSNAVSVPQMMITLLQNNPEAFIGNNINNLKQGSVLRLSDVNAAANISKEEAMRITDLQWEQWKSSRGTTVGSAPSRSGRPKAVAPPAEARVKLVSPNVSGEAARGRNAPKAAATGGARDPAQAKQELAIAQEALDAQRRETQDIRERVAGLEEQVNTMTRLVQLKDDQLAALQNQAKGKKPDAAASKAAEPEPVAAGAKSDAAAKPAEAAPDAPRSSGLIAGLMHDPKLIGLAVVVAGIVVLLVWLVVRRRKMQQFQESILTLNDSVAEPGFAQNKPDSEDASFMSDFAVSSMEGIQTEISEVDPLSEADVYLAYGRYKQAEELVSQAIEKNPQRAELKMKLLEIHYAAKDANAFALQAGLVRDNFSAKQPEMWARIVEMGRELAPQNPLFGGSGSGGNTHDAGKAVDEFDLGDLNLAAGNNGNTTEDTLLDFDLSGPGSKAKGTKSAALDETALDFDLGDLTLHNEKPGKAAAPAAVADEHSMDFDLSAFDEAEKASTAGSNSKSNEGLDFDFSSFEQEEEKTATKVAAQKDDGLDIDFGTAPAAVKPQPVTAKREANVVDFNTTNTDDASDNQLLDQPDSEAALADGGIDGELDDALFADVDEIGTKLDLAKAYIDMGDSEGARSILDEVIEEGNDNQKQEAQVLMRQIG